MRHDCAVATRPSLPEQMVPLRLLRVLLILFLVSLALIVVDELVLWTHMPAYMRVVATGLASGAIVFALILRGGTVLRFAMRTSPAPWKGFLVCVRLIVRGVRRKRSLSRAVTQARAVMRAVMAPSRISPHLTDSVETAMKIAGAQIHRSPRMILYSSRRPSAVTASDGLHCCVFVSTSLVKALTPSSLVAVLAHECGHIREGHPLRMALMLGLLAGVKMSIGVPPAAVVPIFLAYLMMLREWEYFADRQASKVVGNEAVLEAFNEYRAASGDKDSSKWAEIFCGHPSLHNRIDALKEYGASGGKLEIPEIFPYQPQSAQARHPLV